MANLSIFDDVRKVRILLADVLNEETDAFIELRELTEAEQVEMSSVKTEEGLSFWFKKKLPSLMVDHNFENADGVKIGAQEIINKMLSKGMLMTSIKVAYINFLQLLAPKKTE
jgi:hypothetical protein